MNRVFDSTPINSRSNWSLHQLSFMEVGNSRNQPKESARVIQDQKVTRIVIMVVLVFFITYLPTFTIRRVSIGLFYLSICPHITIIFVVHNYNNKIFPIVIFLLQMNTNASITQPLAYLVCILIACSSVIINPIVYFLAQEKYRNAARALFKDAFRKVKFVFS